MRAGTLVVDIALNLARLQQDMRRATDTVQGSMQGIERSVNVARSALGALGVTLSAGFLAKFTLDANKATAALDDMAVAAGASVEKLSALEARARIGGHDFAGLTDGIGRLIKGLKDVDPQGQAAGRALDFLGIKAKDTNGRFRDSVDVLVDVAAALDEYESGGNKVALVQDLLGRGAAKYLPLLQDMAQDGRLQARVTAEQAEAAERFEKSWNRLIFSLEESKRILVGDMVPALQAVTEQLNAAAKASGGFWAGLNQILSVGGDQARDPLAALQEVEKRLATLRADRAVLAGDSLGARFNRMMAPEDLAMLNRQIAHAETQQGILREMMVSRVSGNAAGFTEDAAGNLVPRQPKALNYQTTDPQQAARAAAAEQKAYLDQLRLLAEFEDREQKALDAGYAHFEKLEQEKLELMARAAAARERMAEEDEQRADARLQRQAEEERRLAEEVQAWKLREAERYNQAIEERATRNRDILAQSITDGIMRGFERGEDFWQVFANSIRNSVLTVTVQPAVLGLSTAIAAPIGALASAGTNTLLGNLGLAGNAASTWGGGLSLGSFGGLATGLTADAATTAALIESGTVGAAGAGLEAAALGGWGGALGAALPWIGGGLLAAGALGMFDGDGDAQRTSPFRQGFGESSPYPWEGNRWFSGDMWAAQEEFQRRIATQEQNLIHNLRLGGGEIARVNAALGDANSRVYGFGMEGTDIRSSGGFEAVQSARLQAISSALGRSIEELTRIMSMSTEQWQAAIEQMEQALQGAEQTLAGHVRNLPGQLGITALEDFQAGLAVAEDRAPLDRLAAARQIYEETIARARSGDLSAVQEATSAAQTFYSIGRDVYASGSGFQGIRGEIEQSIQSLKDRQLELQAEIVRDVPLTIMEASRDQVAEIKTQTAALVEKLEDLRREVAKLR